MEEFNVKLAPTASNKKFNVFKLHRDDKVSWTEAKMRRENDYQPWQIKFGSGRTSRRFKAIKEGGVGDNASYFIFYKSNDKSDTYEICPVDEWYSVSATQRYKTLTAEEAEQKFEQRHKMLNLFSVMHMKKGGETEEDGTVGSDSKNFKVSELDDWDNSGDDDRSDDGDDNDDEKKKKNRKKKGIKKEDAEDAPEEGKEDSDEGDFEQREVDYMSDSSSESDDEDPEDRKDKSDVRGIAEEQALRDLLSSEDEEEEEDGQNPQRKAIKSRCKQEPDENGSDDSSDSDDYDVDEDKMDSMLMKKGLPAQIPMIKPEVEQQPSTSVKRKVPTETVASPPKRPCIDHQEKLVEELIKKYLSRKPMTLKNLLKDIRSKLRRMDGMTPEMDSNLVGLIASIMKRLAIDKQRINDATYFSLKSAN